MTRYIAVLFLVISINIVSVITVQGGESSKVELPETPIDQLIKKLKPVSSLQGLFKQRIMDREGVVLQETSGEFKVKQPGNFYWKTTVPYDQLLVTDNKTLWQYDGDLDQVLVKPYGDSIGVTPALLLSGEVDKLRTAYSVSIPSSNTEIAEQNRTFELLPLQASNLFEKLIVKFKDNKVKSMILLDSLGQKTELIFSQMQFNIEIPSSMFTFVAPEGVDVINDE